ncbi:MAG: DUF721 domain-containing protein [Desulfobacteraceae bacterium]|nr:DUF721 domain-containing protein [Desulfobacteraceae bacterium]
MNQKRTECKRFSPIGEVVATVLQQYRPAMDQSMLHVWKIWQTAVGDAIAANARPMAFKGDMLLVHVSSSTWLHHLRMLEKEIVAKINNALGSDKMRSIKLKVGTF